MSHQLWCFPVTDADIHRCTKCNLRQFVAQWVLWLIGKFVHVVEIRTNVVRPADSYVNEAISDVFGY